MNENENKKALQSAFRVISVKFREKLQSAISGVSDKVQDIVFRAERPVCVYLGRKQMYLTKTGCLTETADSQELVYATLADVSDCFNASCGYSVYSHSSEIKEGFITINGGHRVGIAGTAVMSLGEIHNVRDISTVSIRISRQIKGCAENITKDFASSKGGLLICGSPCSGKTTILRDMARLLSTWYGSRVTLVDTRGELASVCNGIAQTDIGMCDILDSYPRSQAIEQAVRSLSPEYILCDEIGSKEDVNAILNSVNSGVRFVASIHAGSKQELLSRKNAEEILGTNAFDKIVFLKGREHAGCIKEQYSIQEFCCV